MTQSLKYEGEEEKTEDSEELPGPLNAGEPILNVQGVLSSPSTEWLRFAPSSHLSISVGSPLSIDKAHLPSGPSISLCFHADGTF